jgi:23S rRNA pseudouridine1911/1915/1917 synthase
VKDLLKEHWSNVQKTYLCLTQQKPEKEEGTIRSWLKDGAKQKVFYYNHEIPDSKYAITHYKFVKTIGKYHLLEVNLETGRKNQIRVHMSEIGCPIVGDWKYGADKSIERQIRLLAWKIEMNHPVTGDHIKVEAPVIRKFYYPSEKENEKYK